MSDLPVGDPSVVEVILAGYDAYNRRDEAALLRFFHPEARWVSSASALDTGVEYVGHPGVRELLADLDDRWERFELEAANVRELPDGRALVVGRVHARSRAGATFDSEVAWLWELRDGQAYRMRTFVDPRTALEAVGATRSFSRERVEAVRAFTDTFNRRTVDEFLALFHPDIVYRTSFGVGGQVYRGIDGVRRFAMDLHETFDFLQGEVEQVLSVDDVVVGVGFFRARGKGSGIEVPQTRLALWIWEFEGDKIIRFTAFDDPAGTLAALARVATNSELASGAGTSH